MGGKEIGRIKLISSGNLNKVIGNLGSISNHSLLLNTSNNPHRTNPSRNKAYSQA